MAKWIAKTKEQYHRAVQEMTSIIKASMAKLQFESVQEFLAFCLNALAYAVQNAPVDTGDLRGTAYLEINGTIAAIGGAGGVSGVDMPTGLEGIDIHARIVFSEEYALIQHEHAEFSHPKGGQAFYLEIGVAQAAKEFAARMAQIAFG